jgi:hypothetical protein
MSDTDEQNLNDLSIDELADRLYVSLWHRNATLGVDQTEVVEALFEIPSPGVDDRRLRVVFDKLKARGYFLARKLTPGHHSSYLFCQIAVPPDDPEAQKEAWEHYRWRGNQT